MIHYLKLEDELYEEDCDLALEEYLTEEAQNRRENLFLAAISIGSALGIIALVFG